MTPIISKLDNWNVISSDLANIENVINTLKQDKQLINVKY